MSRTRQRKQARQRRNLTIGAVVLVVIVVAAIMLIVQGQGGTPAASTAADGRPAWQSMPLTNARTGETFTLADFGEKNVVVKIMSPF